MGKRQLARVLRTCRTGARAPGSDQRCTIAHTDVDGFASCRGPGFLWHGLPARDFTGWEPVPQTTYPWSPSRELTAPLYVAVSVQAKAPGWWSIAGVRDISDGFQARLQPVGLCHRL